MPDRYIQYLDMKVFCYILSAGLGFWEIVAVEFFRWSKCTVWEMKRNNMFYLGK